MIKGSCDFIGINYYTSRYASATPMNQNNTALLSITEAYAEQKRKFKQKPNLNYPVSHYTVFPRELANLMTKIVFKLLIRESLSATKQNDPHRTTELQSKGP